MNESIKAPEGIPTGAITEGERMSTDTRSAEERREECRQLQDRPRQVGAGRAPVVQTLLSLRDNGGL